MISNEWGKPMTDDARRAAKVEAVLARWRALGPDDPWREDVEVLAAEIAQRDATLARLREVLEAIVLKTPYEVGMSQFKESTWTDPSMEYAWFQMARAALAHHAAPTKEHP